MQEVGTTSLEDRHLGCLGTRRPTAGMVRGEGAFIWDTEGTRYLDLTSGYGTAPLGHAHPALSAALKRQAAELVACPGMLYCDVRGRFLEALGREMPAALDRYFLCNSGTEAIEAALKFATLVTGRSRFVAVKGSFHGRTTGALSLTFNPQARQPFERLLLDTRHVTRNDTEALAEAVDDQTAMVVLEVVQGESGVHPLEPEFLRAAQELCVERGALFCVDEIQTGVGRTGAFLAQSHFGLEPDLVTLAKGIGGGVPLGVTCFGERVAAHLVPGVHGTTFGGNALACAAGLATLEALRKEGLVARAAELGERLRSGLESRLEGLRSVRQVRGRGLMLGIELRQKVGPILDLLTREHHLLALPAGSTVLRLLPPLVVEEADLDRAVAAVGTVIEQVERG